MTLLKDTEEGSLLDYATSKLEIIERIEELEDKVFKNNRPEVTLKQKLLLLKHSGILENINHLFKDLDSKNKATFLSVLLDTDIINTTKALRVIQNSKSDLETSKNYMKLVNIFKQVGLTDQEEFCDKRLDELLKNEKPSRKG